MAAAPHPELTRRLRIVRRRARQGWTNKEIATASGGWTAKQVDVALWTLLGRTEEEAAWLV